MSYDINAAITPRAAAKLLISGEMSLNVKFDNATSKRILHELLNLSIDDILVIVDQNSYGLVAEAKYIPQFGTLETVLNVPNYFSQNGSIATDYVQLGFYLKKDLKASLQANCKFGENHGKTAALLGLVCLIESSITPSCFTHAFVDLPKNDQFKLIRRMILRIPIIQILLSNARIDKFNGYIPMAQLKQSTKYRRGTSVRALLRALKELNHAKLNSRIENITWEDL